MLSVERSRCASSCCFSPWSLELAIHESSTAEAPISVRPPWPWGRSSSALELYRALLRLRGSKGCWSRDRFQTVPASVRAEGRQGSHRGTEQNSGASVDNLDFRSSRKSPGQHPTTDVTGGSECELRTWKLSMGGSLCALASPWPIRHVLLQSGLL